MLYSGNDLSFIDADLQGSIRVLGSGDRATGWVLFGYRYVGLDGDYSSGGDNVVLDLSFSGPYIGVSLSF